MNEDNKIIKVRSDETYYCYDWIFKLKCLCSNCLKNYSMYCSPEIATETILSQNFSLVLTKFFDESMTLRFYSKLFTSFDNFKLRISVRNKAKFACYSNEYEIDLKHYDNSWRSYYDILTFINFSLINDCNIYIPERVLTLVVEIFKPVTVIPKNVRNTATNVESVTNLKNLQLSEELSDVTLVAGDREFRAHKAILAAESSVFLAMFKHDVKETNENRVVIEDVSERVMEQVLDYIYGGTVEKENFGVLASEVLIAADKYNLQGLVRICEEVMISLLSADNVLKILATTEVYKLNSLKESALNYIVQNVKEVVESDDFKKFLDSSNHCLMKEIFLAINSKLFLPGA